MADLMALGLVAAACVIGLCVACWAALRGWQGWLELKRLELGRAGLPPAPPSAGGRIELADLRERVRKLEAIAAGIDL